MLKVLIGVVLVGLWVYSVIDVATSPKSAARVLPRFVWLLIALLVPVLGGALWLAFGRPRSAGGLSRRRGPRAPDDDPRFLQALDEEAWRRRMEERRRGEAGA